MQWYDYLFLCRMMTIFVIAIVHIIIALVLYHKIYLSGPNRAMMKWKRKYKRRFNKKPCASCYCKDCKYFWNAEGIVEAGACEFYGKDTPDDGFCWRATRKE